jgi:hypothetical protein
VEKVFLPLEALNNGLNPSRWCQGSVLEYSVVRSLHTMEDFG